MACCCDAAARLITGTRRCQNIHITPILRELHWLPLSQRQFKLAGFVYQALTGQEPVYLAEDCRLISNSDRRLRSADTSVQNVYCPALW